MLLHKYANLQFSTLIARHIFLNQEDAIFNRHGTGSGTVRSPGRDD